MELRRTVPFFLDISGKRVFRIDNLLIGNGEAPQPELVTRIGRTLDLSLIEHDLPIEIAETIIEEQFDAAMDYLFSHPLWEQFRSGENIIEPLLAYLIETRHYLAAAPARMAPGISCSYPDGDITEILARHLLEESNHAIYFEHALETLGVSAETARSVRPDPRTIELIHLMRDVATHDPLSAAVCSGLLESTANNRDCILQWHDMLVQRRLLPASTVEAFKRHVAVDYELGHGRTWREVLRALGPTVHADRLANALNASTLVAEMLFRWFSAFQQGSSGMAVLLLSQDDAGARRTDEQAAHRDRFWSGIPVWPASVMHATAYAANQTFAVRAALSSVVLLEKAPPADVPRALGELAASGWHPDVHPMPTHARDWVRLIDGHRLWDLMLSAKGKSAVALATGWIVENIFYLRAAARHNANVIASCPDQRIRNWMVHHMKEEQGHASILERHLPEGVNLAAWRPLPTTRSFVGALVDAARADWKAYCLAQICLQGSLRDNSDAFYEAVGKTSARAAQIIVGMRDHDHIDRDCGHCDDADELATLLSPYTLEPMTLEHGALIGQLAWSFLDGIADHYVHEASVAQRIGWIG
ncbi:iron-containing redox enzyme family protein [Burkholderia sp. BDU5]|uniref:iron-containing redox enzyme family protein n=1 Tax=Burkholderia sp. BDU5 TaxID=1385590 RepID=UPI000AED99AD|nr:iron-containing redox enzyme family protein [Burkholderia sp. BDU5]